MTAPAFDAEAIARKVFDAEQSAIDEHELPPLARTEGMTVTGSGDGRGRPVPTEPVGRGDDIFDRLERQRAAKAVRSPFGPPEQRTVTKPSTAAVVERQVDAQRFVAPPVVQAEPEPQVTAPAVVDDPPAVVEPVVQKGCPVQHCGDMLTGGGAPRGWVLVRVIGQGQSRRYCSPACAVEALSNLGLIPSSPQSVRERSQVSAVSARCSPRRAPVPSTLDVPEIVRRYQAGETAPQIGKALGHTAGTIRKALDRAGIERRDDRATASGSHPKEYDPQLVARVRALYTLHKLTQAEVAEAIRSSTKVVQNIMARHGIEARPPASVAGHPGARADRARPLKQLMADRGITSAQVRAWARITGRDVTVVGLVPAHLVDAYLAAHQNGATTA